ncbi:50S ribosomal protein L29 [Candidatus Uhrbacteria bacterium CG10_big_fil_rev_8_21_14_0_10_48_16]|uniref:Large ribosomal subunit protein uL29 n=1 Tax=Candidatus Uhrbacteria bacterium CG10_big_fil_rev_8_21_14_0_10_48_16 TaxID=1975038 RepID=A0A2M8LGQ8_9BACT|nr:MAG: 50S ribosomal protein L29 [Candidatus Uhrbacteria bacterium CG10_big_fil_rev_8_21_14_0_10_48_16]
MDVKTLRSKSATVLTKEMDEAYARLKELRFKLSSNQLKNVREVRVLKRGIAKIKTLLAQMEVIETTKSE